MIVCKKCGREVSEEFKFCGYCGNNLEDKVNCQDCHQEIPNGFAFCPHCGRKVESITYSPEVVDKVPPIVNQNLLKKVIPTITNTIVLVISMITILLMFGKVSSFGVQTVSFDNTLVKYCEASINGIGKYTFEDFEKHYLRDARKINVLNMFMVDDDNMKTETYHAITNITTLILLAMVIMPLILMALTIKDLVNNKHSKRYRKFFLINVALGFTAITLFKMMHFKIGTVVIFYIFFSLMVLIYDLIIQVLMQKIKFNPIKVITPIAIILIFILLNGRIAKFTDQSSTESIYYGTFVSVIDSLYQENGFSMYNTSFTSMFTSEKMQEANLWIIYFSLLIPLFMVASIGFLIAGLFSEIKDSLNMHDEDDSSTCTFLWTSTIFCLLSIVAVVVVNLVCNFFFNEFGYEGLTNSISLNIIVVIILLLALSIFRSIVKRKVYE